MNHPKNSVSFYVHTYVVTKRCLFVRELNKGSNDVVKEYVIDEDLGPAPTNTCRDETAAKDVY